MPRSLSVKALCSLLIAMMLASCVVLPRTDFVYDEECKVLRRHMVLDVHQAGSIGACANEGCALLLVSFGAVAVASAVVSGSIALIGNAVYWLEQRGQCSK